MVQRDEEKQKPGFLGFPAREEDMAAEKTIQRGKGDSDFSKEENHLPLLMDGNFEVIHDFQFEEGAYFEAVVDMEEWI
jgi:hypothetical protein